LILTINAALHFQAPMPQMKRLQRSQDHQRSGSKSCSFDGRADRDENPGKLWRGTPKTWRPTKFWTFLMFFCRFLSNV
jgi:hypothetical protein